MADNLRSQIKSRMEQLSSEELLQIWTKNDRDEYAEHTFDIIREILEERGEAVPVQSQPRNTFTEHDDLSTGGFLSFGTMISSSLIKAIYVIGLIGVTLIGLGFMFGLKQYLFGLLVIIFGNLLWRLVCEAAIIFYRIHDLLASIDRQLKKIAG